MIRFGSVLYLRRAAWEKGAKSDATWWDWEWEREYFEIRPISRVKVTTMNSYIKRNMGQFEILLYPLLFIEQIQEGDNRLSPTQFRFSSLYTHKHTQWLIILSFYASYLTGRGGWWGWGWCWTALRRARLRSGWHCGKRSIVLELDERQLCLTSFLVNEIVVVLGWDVEGVAFLGVELGRVEHHRDLTFQHNKHLMERTRSIKVNQPVY